MHLVSMGQPVASVPFVYNGVKLSVLHGDAALAARRHVASKLTPSMKIPDGVLLVVDGAYAEYVQETDYCDGLDLVSEDANTVMTRTFSKVYGLASLRIGWAYCPTFIIDTLNKIRGPFNLSTASIYAGAAALDDTEHVRKSIALNIEEKNYLYKKYSELGAVSYTHLTLPTKRIV